MLAENVRSEDGAVAIMYSILMLVFIGFVAIVLDLGALRADRRNTQLLADNAATSGASYLLEEFDGSPMEACNAAWEYFLLNTPEVDPNGPWDNPCDGTTAGGPSIDSWTCATAPAYDPVADTGPWVVGQAGPYEAVIVWPVPDELIAGDGYSDELDGAPCERLGVWVRRTRGFIFGGIFAQGATIGAPAVARVAVGGDIDEVASLVVLDPVGCKSLDVQGQGIAAVLETAEGPGIITMDSDASDETSSTSSGRNCTQGGGQVSIHADNNNSGGCPVGPQIKAGLTEASYDAWSAGAGSCTFDVGNGIITSMALGGPFRDRAYEEADVTADRLGPRPVYKGRITRQIADHEFNCQDSYSFSMPYAQQPSGDPWACEDAYDPAAPDADALPPFIDHLRQVVGATGLPGSISPLPALPPSPSEPLYPDYSTRPLFGQYEGEPFLSYRTYVTAEYGIGNPCQLQTSDPAITIPEGNWWVDCPSLSIGNLLTFTRGNVVTDGPVEVNGSLTINAANDGMSDGFLYVRNGRFFKVAQAHVTLNRTFVYLHNGHIDFRAGDPPLTWIAPDDSAYPTHPVTGVQLTYPFDDLNLWSENTTTHSLGGKTALDIEGVFFIPRALFAYDGQGRQDQKKAQFITWRMNVSGQGSLIMAPDPTRALETPQLQVRLIR